MISARQTSGYDTLKANTNLGYGFVYCWAEILEKDLDNIDDSVEAPEDLIKSSILNLYQWIDKEDADTQDGAEDALTTLEQSDWVYARDIMEAELSIMADMGIELSMDYV